MSQFRLACNIKQCRKTLLKSAYVTKCSHIFCNAHGLNITNSEQLTCPVCDNHFQTIQDVIRVNLEPDEVTKSVLVAGLRPEVIMDIATRALAFWGFQVNEENLYLEAGLKTANENIAVLEKYCENSHAKYKSEINTLERKIESLNEELEVNRKRCQDLIQQLEEKSKLIHKLQLNNIMGATGGSGIKQETLQNCYDPKFTSSDDQNLLHMAPQLNSFILKQEESPNFNPNNNFKFKPNSTYTPPQSMPSFHHRGDMAAEKDFHFQPNM